MLELLRLSRLSFIWDEVTAALPIARMQLPCGLDHIEQLRVPSSNSAAVGLVELFLVPLESGRWAKNGERVGWIKSVGWTSDLLVEEFEGDDAPLVPLHVELPPMWPVVVMVRPVF